MLAAESKATTKSKILEKRRSRRSLLVEKKDKMTQKPSFEEDVSPRTAKKNSRNVQKDLETSRGKVKGDEKKRAIEGSGRQEKMKQDEKPVRGGGREEIKKKQESLPRKDVTGGKKEADKLGKESKIGKSKNKPEVCDEPTREKKGSEEQKSVDNEKKDSISKTRKGVEEAARKDSPLTQREKKNDSISIKSKATNQEGVSDQKELQETTKAENLKAMKPEKIDKEMLVESISIKTIEQKDIDQPQIKAKENLKKSGSGSNKSTPVETAVNIQEMAVDGSNATKSISEKEERNTEEEYKVPAVLPSENLKAANPSEVKEEKPDKVVLTDSSVISSKASSENGKDSGTAIKDEMATPRNENETMVVDKKLIKDLISTAGVENTSDDTNKIDAQLVKRKSEPSSLENKIEEVLGDPNKNVTKELTQLVENSSNNLNKVIDTHKEKKTLDGNTILGDSSGNQNKEEITEAVTIDKKLIQDFISFERDRITGEDTNKIDAQLVKHESKAPLLENKTEEVLEDPNKNVAKELTQLVENNSNDLSKITDTHGEKNTFDGNSILVDSSRNQNKEEIAEAITVDKKLIQDFISFERDGITSEDTNKMDAQLVKHESKAPSSENKIEEVLEDPNRNVVKELSQLVENSSNDLDKILDTHQEKKTSDDKSIPLNSKTIPNQLSSTNLISKSDETNTSNILENTRTESIVAKPKLMKSPSEPTESLKSDRLAKSKSFDKQNVVVAATTPPPTPVPTKINKLERVSEKADNLEEEEEREKNKAEKVLENKYDPSKLKEELAAAQKEAELNTYTNKFNPHLLRQEIKNASVDIGEKMPQRELEFEKNVVESNQKVKESKDPGTLLTNNKQENKLAEEIKKIELAKNNEEPMQDIPELSKGSKEEKKPNNKEAENAKEAEMKQHKPKLIELPIKENNNFIENKTELLTISKKAENKPETSTKELGAVLKIQSFFRGFKIRKQFETNKKTNNDDNETIATLKHVTELETNIKNLSADFQKEVAAAMTIQRFWRNLLKKKHEASKTQNQASMPNKKFEEQVRAALTIQKFWKRNRAKVQGSVQDYPDGKVKNAQEIKLSEKELKEALEILDQIEVPSESPKLGRRKREADVPLMRSVTVEEPEVLKKTMSVLGKSRSVGFLFGPSSAPISDFKVTSAKEDQETVDEALGEKNDLESIEEEANNPPLEMEGDIKPSIQKEEQSKDFTKKEDPQIVAIKESTLKRDKDSNGEAECETKVAGNSKVNLSKIKDEKTFLESTGKEVASQAAHQEKSRGAEFDDLKIKENQANNGKEEKQGSREIVGGKEKPLDPSEESQKKLAKSSRAAMEREDEDKPNETKIPKKPEEEQNLKDTKKDLRKLERPQQQLEKLKSEDKQPTNKSSSNIMKASSFDVSKLRSEIEEASKPSHQTKSITAQFLETEKLQQTFKFEEPTKSSDGNNNTISDHLIKKLERSATYTCERPLDRETPPKTHSLDVEVEEHQKLASISFCGSENLNVEGVQTKATVSEEVEILPKEMTRPLSIDSTTSADSVVTVVPRMETQKSADVLVIPQEEKCFEEDMAATKIQAAYRGHRARSTLKKRESDGDERNNSKGDEEVKNNMDRENNSVKLMQTKEVKPEESENKKEKETVMEEPSIQDLAKSTEKLEIENQEGDANKDLAAVKIQSTYRGHRVRRNVKNKIDKEPQFDPVEEKSKYRAPEDTLSPKRHDKNSTLLHSSEFHDSLLPTHIENKKQSVSEENITPLKAELQNEGFSGASKLAQSQNEILLSKHESETKQAEVELKTIDRSSGESESSTTLDVLTDKAAPHANIQNQLRGATKTEFSNNAKINNNKIDAEVDSSKKLMELTPAEIFPKLETTQKDSSESLEKKTDLNTSVVPAKSLKSNINREPMSGSSETAKFDSLELLHKESSAASSENSMESTTKTDAAPNSLKSSESDVIPESSISSVVKEFQAPQDQLKITAESKSSKDNSVERTELEDILDDSEPPVASPELTSETPQGSTKAVKKTESSKQIKQDASEMSTVNNQIAQKPKSSSASSPISQESSNANVDIDMKGKTIENTKPVFQTDEIDINSQPSSQIRSDVKQEKSKFTTETESIEKLEQETPEMFTTDTKFFDELKSSHNSPLLSLEPSETTIKADMNKMITEETKPVVQTDETYVYSKSSTISSQIQPDMQFKESKIEERIQSSKEVGPDASEMSTSDSKVGEELKSTHVALSKFSETSHSQIGVDMKGINIENAKPVPRTYALEGNSKPSTISSHVQPVNHPRESKVDAEAKSSKEMKQNSTLDSKIDGESESPHTTSSKLSETSHAKVEVDMNETIIEGAKQMLQADEIDVKPEPSTDFSQIQYDVHRKTKTESTEKLEQGTQEMCLIDPRVDEEFKFSHKSSLTQSESSHAKIEADMNSATIEKTKTVPRTDEIDTTSGSSTISFGKQPDHLVHESKDDAKVKSFKDRQESMSESKIDDKPFDTSLLISSETSHELIQTNEMDVNSELPVTSAQIQSEVNQVKSKFGAKTKSTEELKQETPEMFIANTKGDEKCKSFDASSLVSLEEYHTKIKVNPNTTTFERTQPVLHTNKMDANTKISATIPQHQEDRLIDTRTRSLEELKEEASEMPIIDTRIDENCKSLVPQEASHEIMKLNASEETISVLQSDNLEANFELPTTYLQVQNGIHQENVNPNSSEELKREVSEMSITNTKIDGKPKSSDDSAKAEAKQDKNGTFTEETIHVLQTDKTHAISDPSSTSFQTQPEIHQENSKLDAEAKSSKELKQKSSEMSVSDTRLDDGLSPAPEQAPHTKVKVSSRDGTSLEVTKCVLQTDGIDGNFESSSSRKLDADVKSSKQLKQQGPEMLIISNTKVDDDSYSVSQERLHAKMKVDMNETPLEEAKCASEADQSLHTSSKTKLDIRHDNKSREEEATSSKELNPKTPEMSMMKAMMDEDSHSILQKAPHTEVKVYMNGTSLEKANCMLETDNGEATFKASSAFSQPQSDIKQVNRGIEREARSSEELKQETSAMFISDTKMGDDSPLVHQEALHSKVKVDMNGTSLEKVKPVLQTDNIDANSEDSNTFSQPQSGVQQENRKIEREAKSSEELKQEMSEMTINDAKMDDDPSPVPQETFHAKVKVDMNGGSLEETKSVLQTDNIDVNSESSTISLQAEPEFNQQNGDYDAKMKSSEEMEQGRKEMPSTGTKIDEKPKSSPTSPPPPGLVYSGELQDGAAPLAVRLDQSSGQVFVIIVSDFHYCLHIQAFFR